MKKHAMLVGALLLGFISALSYAQAPVPFINQPLIPDATAPGGAQFTLTVNGTGFVSKSVVNWNGSALATQFVSGSQLKAIVPAADIATANTASVTVVNPAPGGGTSGVEFFTATADTGNSAGFGLVSSPTVQNHPWAVAVGDFNGDGKLDLAVANYRSQTLSILLGDGTGNFTLASSLVIGPEPRSIAVGDFNGDGKLDLAVGHLYGHPLSILLGDGVGNFTLAASLDAGGWAQSVAVGDFNGDGKLDLAVANEYADTVSILLGDGTGNFTLASSLATGGWADSVAVGDFNGDGKLDLAVADDGLFYFAVAIFLGDGTGGFSLASSLEVVGPNSVAVGDFNGDGKLDLAVASGYHDGSGHTVSILLGDGTGNFTLDSSPAVGNWPDSVAVGDFNGDGKLDLAVANHDSNTVSILLGDGTGNFTLASSPAVGGGPGSVAVGDFNGDGKTDLAVANGGGNTVSILLGAVPPVVLSPISLNFGTQLVGTKSTQPVTLTNVGSDTLDISKIAASGHFFSQTNNCPSSVPPGGQCTINVNFKPLTHYKDSGAITIKDNAPTSPQTVPLTGSGTWVTLLPTSLNFGGQTVGTTSQPQTVTFTNDGTAAVNIWRLHFTGRNPGAFAQTNTCGTSVPPGGNCTISVTFTPKYRGGNTATLEVNDNGGGSPQTVALSGSGTK